MATEKALLNPDIMKNMFNYRDAKSTLRINNKELHLLYFFSKTADFPTSKLICQKILYLHLCASYRK